MEKFEQRQPVPLRLLLVLSASLIFAFNINTFVHSASLFPGGFAGVALLIQKSFKDFLGVALPYSALTYALNAIPIVIGFRFIGKKFTVLSCVLIVVSWLGIWHWCLKREIGIRFRDALRDILPFMLVAAGSMIATYLITSFITNIYLLIVVRILLAASLYLGIMWLLGAAIMRECLDYIFKKKH